MLHRGIRLGIVLGVLAAAFAGLASWWRRHRRFGSGFVTHVLDPWLVRHDIAAGSKGEIGLLAHVGRTTGLVRLTPVHPVPIEGGFRIIVPLGFESQWARNVLAAGHCRLQVGETVLELDEPSLVSPLAARGGSRATAAWTDWLGFRYLILRTVIARPGRLDESPDAAAIPA
jgi:hypothetical protein